MSEGRRRFLKELGILSAAPATAASAAAPGAEPEAAPAESPAAETPAFHFLTGPEAAFLDAALGRLIPDDELGPGARGAGVTVFIDRQLAGPFGTMARGYRLGPWAAGTPEQGYQSKLTPQEVYRVAIAEVDRHCEARHGRAFVRLSAAAQDEVLRGLESGTIVLPSVSASFFFGLLWANTQEGFFADPIHGGNRGKAGWRLVGFPGVAAVYTSAIEKHFEPYRVEPVSIADVQGRRTAVDEHGHPVHRLSGPKDGRR